VQGNSLLLLISVMLVVGLTETFADVSVRIQLTRFSESVHVWVSTDASATSLAIATPGRRAASSVLLGGAGAVDSLAFAEKLSSRTGLTVYSCVQLSPDAELLKDSIMKRVLAEMNELFSDGNSGAVPLVDREQ
jgi:Proteasome assembly chaperone 4